MFLQFARSTAYEYAPSGVSWQRDISVLQVTKSKIFWDIFFSLVIRKRFGKGSDMKPAFSHQSNAAFARGSDNRFQNKQFGITRVLLSSPLPSRRQQTDDYGNQQYKHWQAAAPETLNTAVCMSARLQPALRVPLVFLQLWHICSQKLAVSFFFFFP